MARREHHFKVPSIRSVGACPQRNPITVDQHTIQFAFESVPGSNVGPDRQVIPRRDFIEGADMVRMVMRQQDRSGHVAPGQPGVNRGAQMRLFSLTARAGIDDVKLRGPDQKRVGGHFARQRRRLQGQDVVSPLHVDHAIGILKLCRL